MPIGVLSSYKVNRNPSATPPLRSSENLDFLLFITVLMAYKAL